MAQANRALAAKNDRAKRERMAYATDAARREPVGRAKDTLRLDAALASMDHADRQARRERLLAHW